MGDLKAENAHHAGAGGSRRGAVSTPSARRAFHETCELIAFDRKMTDGRTDHRSQNISGSVFVGFLERCCGGNYRLSGAGGWLIVKPETCSFIYPSFILPFLIYCL